MPEITERELEDYVFNHLDYFLDEKGFEGYIKKVSKHRQFNIGVYGRMDTVLFFIDSEPNLDDTIGHSLNIIIFEFKKDTIDFNSIGQISKYKTAIERNLGNINLKKYGLSYSEVKGILIGKKFQKGDVCYIVDSIDWLNVYFYDLSLEKGIIFDNNTTGWYNPNENQNYTIEKIIRKALFLERKKEKEKYVEEIF